MIVTRSIKVIPSKIHSYLLITILITAAILRFNQIDQPFIDVNSWRQASAAMMADNFYRNNWNILYPEISWDGPGPSYNGREFQTVSYLAAMFYVLVGQHDWVGRSIAVMFGLWGIFALYKLIKCVWDTEHALIGAAVMALLPGSIFIDREFLPDPAMVALVTTGCWLLVVYSKTERLPYLLLAATISTWGFLTKLTGLIVGIPMLYAAFAILGYKRMLTPKKLIPIGISAVVGLSVVIAYYLWARHLSQTYPPYHFAGAGSWLWDHGLVKWLGEKYYLSRTYYHFDQWFWTKPVIALVVIGFFLPPNMGLMSANQHESVQSNPNAPWLFHWWVVGFAVYYLIGAKHLVDQPYNFHLVNPAAAALAGHAILAAVSLINKAVFSPVSLATIAVILLLVGGFGQKKIGVMYYPYARESYELGLALHQFTQPDDLVVTIANQIGDPVAIYYSQQRGWVFPPAWPGVVWWWDDDLKDENKAVRFLEELRTEGADWLGIVGEQRIKLLEDNPTLMEHIERTCELSKESPEWVIYRILSPEEVLRRRQESNE
jgi:hypothetical protein